MRVGRKYLCDEVGVRHEKLLQDVDDCKKGSQLVLESRFGGFPWRRALLACAAEAAGLAVNAGSAGLRVRRGERQNRPEEPWETGEESSWPIRVAEQRTGGQHGVGKHPCGAPKLPVR